MLGSVAWGIRVAWEDGGATASSPSHMLAPNLGAGVGAGGRYSAPGTWVGLFCHCRPEAALPTGDVVKCHASAPLRTVRAL